MKQNVWPWLIGVARAVRRAAIGVVELLLALILLFEEWGWRPLADLVARLRHFAFWARFEAWLESLPAYGALAVFGAPPVVLFPIKLLGLWLIADGRLVSAALLIVAAKLVGTAFVARVFVITRPKLMSIPWFAWAYNLIVPWQEALFARIRATWAWRVGRIVKARVARIAQRVWARYGAAVRARVAEAGARVREVVARLLSSVRRS
jgi:hypothetical protein